MYYLLLTPPAAFIVILLLSWLMSYLSSFVAFNKPGVTKALTKAYTGGEEVKTSRIQPDYSQFFPFAFFFTILHVVTLVLATVPKENVGSFTIAFVYIAGALLALFILFRR